MSKTLLVLGYVWPEPDSSAAGSHMLSLLHTFLQDGWQITFASPANSGEHKTDLTQLGIEEVNIALNCKSFDEFVQQLQPDVVIFDRFMLEEQFAWRVARTCPSALRILDTEDLHSLRQARHDALKKQIHFAPSQMHNELGIREIAAILRSDLTLILSSYEMQLLQTHFQVPASHLLYQPFMLETPNIIDWPDYTERQHFISIGNFRHAPNWDAVLWLKQQIWPRIRQKLPCAELHIYGAYPPKKATQLTCAKQGFLVKGWTSSAAQVMSSARICLAPLRFGAGIKGKLAEAMQCGTPSVTTAIGIEGMADAAHWPGLIAESPQNIAEQAVQLYQTPTLWQQKQQLALPLLNRQFNPKRLRQQLLNKVNQLRANLDEHREQHFIGQLLQHQSMRASQYMSQWIEAKNANSKHT